jgi:hypothetical protein
MAEPVVPVDGNSLREADRNESRPRRNRNWLEYFLGPHLGAGISNVLRGAAEFSIGADLREGYSNTRRAVSEAMSGRFGQAAGHAGLAAATIPMLFMPGTTASVKKGTDLAMDEASRMARADEMFPVVAYSGEAQAIAGDAYILGHPGRKDIGFMGEGFYASSSPSIASIYADLKRPSQGAEHAPNVVPIRLSLHNPYEIDMHQKASMRSWSEEKRAAWLKDKLDQGHDGIVVTYPHLEFPGGPPVREYMVPDTAQVRSPFADFDPDKVSSSDLLAFNDTARGNPLSNAAARRA